MTPTVAIDDVRLVDRAGRYDVLIADGRFERIEPAGWLAGTEAGRRIDGRRLLALPGLCNAHLHSGELPLRGHVHNLPQELYHACIHPLGIRHLLTPDQVYASTLASCVEMLRNGVTMAVDDLLHATEAHLEAVVRAYSDSGMRARVTVHLLDKPWTESVPFIDELLPPDLADALRIDLPGTTDEQLELCERAVRSVSGGDGRVRCIVAPSAPQRCSEALLRGADAICRAAGVPLHVHVQETLVQGVNGPRLYGTSMVGHLEQVGALGPHTTVVHGVWLTADDIRLVAERGASVVHNPVSNLRLGCGVAPVRELLRAGVNVALGCDGYTSNDGQDVFEAMKCAALIGTLRSVDYREWLTPAEVLQMATVGGPRANLIDDVGTLAVGARADLVLLDVDEPELRPLTDPLAQVVFSGSGRNVRAVVVDGQVLVEDGAVTVVDPRATWEAADRACEAFVAAAGPGLHAMERAMPALAAAYARGVGIAAGGGWSTHDLPPRLGAPSQWAMTNEEAR